MKFSSQYVATLVAWGHFLGRGTDATFAFPPCGRKIIDGKSEKVDVYLIRFLINLRWIQTSICVDEIGIKNRFITGGD